MRWQSWSRGLVLRPISSLSAASSPSRIPIRSSRSDASDQGACWGTGVCRLVWTSLSISVGYTEQGRRASSPGRRPREQAIILPREMSSVFWLFYQLAAGMALLAAGPFLLARRGSHYLPTLSGRLGWAPGPGETAAPAPGALWLHAVSVGEVGVAAALARALPPEVPL